MTGWRPARFEDMAVLAGWIESPQALARWGGPSLTWPMLPGQLWQQIDAESFPSFSLEDNGELLAFGQLSPRDEAATWHLCRLIVAPHRRGQQLGDRLCRYLIERAIPLGATQITLNVAAGNLPAVRLYQRLGFLDNGPVNERGIQPMALQL
ncbi:acetyltransferase (GNAT) family protein [Kushneria indalinina DSM 14324]|uniref:Acetyltransferase (GNAT) family protein n=2 Tax=Kushneria indalinina TaxID=184067 RepID=A0A3D9DRZ4_9GAMM|nr:acetyltransferase (GNAT) family protein [Kushneria indalinina DSM 14324]